MDERLARNRIESKEKEKLIDQIEAERDRRNNLIERKQVQTGENRCKLAKTGADD